MANESSIALWRVVAIDRDGQSLLFGLRGKALEHVRLDVCIFAPRRRNVTYERGSPYRSFVISGKPALPPLLLLGYEAYRFPAVDRSGTLIWR